MTKFSEDNIRRMGNNGWHRRPDLDDANYMAWAIPSDRIAKINQQTGQVVITEAEKPCPS